MILQTQNFTHIIAIAHKLRHMDKLKDEIITDQTLLRTKQEAMHAIIAMIVFLILMAVFYFFG